MQHVFLQLSINLRTFLVFCKDNNNTQYSMNKLKNLLTSSGRDCVAWRYLMMTLIAILTSVSANAQDNNYWDTYMTSEEYSTYQLKTTTEGSKTVFQIETAADLGYVAHLANQTKVAADIDQLQNGVIRLYKDIDLGAHRWRALGEGVFAYTGTFDGNGHTISNLRLEGGNGTINSGLIDVGGSGICVKDLTLKNAYGTIAENGGLVVGHLKEASNATIENIKLYNCRSYCDNKNGMLIGFVEKSSNLKISNILIQGAYSNGNSNSQGNNYNGTVAGWIRESSGFEINNVKVQNTVVQGNMFVGGIVGEIMSSSGTIKNSFVSVKFQGNKDCCGGIVGKILNRASSVIIDNCIVDMNSNPFTTKNRIGGVVGYVNNDALATLKNTAVLAEKNKVSFAYPQDQGLLVGCNWDDKGTTCGHVRAEGCYIDLGYGQLSKDEFVKKCFGSSIVDWRPSFLHYVDLYPYSSPSQDAHSVACVAKMNELGACFGVTPKEELSDDNNSLSNPFMPLTDKSQGMIVGYKYTDETPMYAVHGVGDDALPANLSWDSNENMIMMKYGQPTSYEFDYDGKKWLVDEEITNCASNQRDTLQRFTAMPESPGVITGRYVPRPEIRINETTFNEVKKSVTLRWTVDNYDPDIWKDSKWVITHSVRDDAYSQTTVTDTISIDNREWTDVNPGFGRDNAYNSYSVNLICPSLGYYSSIYAGYATILSNNKMNIYAEKVKGEGDRIHVTAKIPNSKYLDGGIVRLLKWETTQNEAEAVDSTEFVIKDPDKYLACTKEFKFEPSNSDDYIYFDLTDESSVNSCSMNHYVVILDYDTEGTSSEHITLTTNSLDFAAQKDVSFASFTASKGEFTSKVVLSWNVKNKTNADMLFAISRKLYTAGDGSETEESDWDLVETINGTGGAMTYTDETFPGYVYQYRIRAYPKCESTASTNVWDAEIQGIGYAASRGTIMGTISYGGGSNYVEGVDVRLTPDTDTFADKGSAYSMYFNGDEDCLPLMPNMGESFWNGNWTIQFLLRPEDNQTSANGLRVMTLPGRFALNISGNSLLLAGKAMTVTDRTWNNHIVLSHTNDGYKLGITSIKDGKETTTWAASVTDKEMTKWMTNRGEAEKADTLYFGRTAKQLSDDSIEKTFVGKIDEVRLWSRELSEAELLQTYDRYLTGGELNLAAYYTFDSGVREYAFDSSHPKGKWNNRNTELPNVQHPRIKDDVPGSEALCYRGTTDKGGNYQIAGVPFIGEGTNYMVVPVFGTHEFQPASIRRYVSNQSLTHSNVDFTDKSSFHVKVKACYALGNYPVKGLYILVDNTPVSDSDMKNVVTDENGEADIQVPIGLHKLSLAGDASHTLLNGGFPCSVNGVNDNGEFSFTPLRETELEGYMNFQADRTAPVTFFDGSFVRIAGKIVGGSVERDKPIGFGLTNANLGNAEMIIEPQKNANSYQLYNFGNEGSIFEMANTIESDTLGNGGINSRTLYKSGSSQITIKVDPATGEFLALVPPVNMQVKTVRTTGTIGTQLVNDDFRYSNILPTIDFNENTLYADTLRNGDKVTEFSLFKYHAKKVYTYYSEPKFDMYNPDATVSSDSLMHGSEYFTNYWYDDNEEEHRDSVALWNPELRDGSPESYTLKTKDSNGNMVGLPVFKTGLLYNTNMRVFEKYTNLTTGRDSIYNLNNIGFIIHNNISTVGYVNYSNTYQLDSEKVDKQTIYTDEDGIVRYAWVAGYPNPAGDHTLSMNVTYTANGEEFAPANGVIRGIVLGNVPIPGTNFVTAGPNNVSFVLRDPPGSSSYSWLEKGSSMSHNYHSESGWSSDNSESNAICVGTSDQSYMGSVVGAAGGGAVKINLTTKVDNAANHNVAFFASFAKGDTEDKTYTITTNNKLQTSTDAGYVGANGDLYVGTSRNMTFSECNTVGFKKAEASEPGAMPTKDKSMYYTLSSGKNIAQTDSFTTMFAYSQKHIVDELIPELKKLRRERVDEWVDDISTVIGNKASGNTSRYYALRKHKNVEVTNDDDLWTPNVDYYWAAPENTTTSDTVNIYNMWIEGWGKAIEHNEKTKYETAKKFTSQLTYEQDKVQTDYGYMGNVSLDAGGTQQSTITRSYSDAGGSYFSKSYGIEYTYNHTFKNILFFSNTKLKATFKTKDLLTHKHTNKNTTTNTQTFGYNMHDAKSGNFFSVDVYLPGYVTGKGDFKDLYGSSPNFDEFFVFRTRGGQSKCPYQATETSLYYKENGKNVTLNDGTIAIEDPEIKFETPDITGVPAGEPCYVKVRLSNKSAATVKLGSAFNLAMVQNTNPNGLKLSIDGVPVGNNNANQIALLPGASITKTIEIRQTDDKILDYDNVVLVFASDCDGTNRFAKDSIRVHFKPASSPLKMKQMQNIINAEDTPDTTAVFRISGYDISRPGFTGIRLKKRKAGELDFTTEKILINDKNISKYEELYGSIDWNKPEYMHLNAEGDEPVTEVKVKMRDWDEGNYQFYAESFTPETKAKESTTQTDTITIFKDTKRPERLVDPSPTDGYYGIGSEISLQMNENIQMENVTSNNFSVTAVLNDAKVTHLSGLHFDGNTPAKTTSRVQIYDQSTAFAFWYKPVVGKKSCLMSQTLKGQGGQEMPFKIFYNEDATMSVAIGDDIYTNPDKKAVDSDGNPISDWMYAIVTYENDSENNGGLKLFNLFGTSNEAKSLFLNLSLCDPTVTNANVPLYVGGSEQGDPCYADIEQFVVYDEAESFEYIAAEKGQKQAANCRGLLAYWPMDESSGLYAHDRIHSRDLKLQGTDNWYLPVTNYALNLNGENEYMAIKTDKFSVGKNEDYCLEFWFRSAAKDMAAGEEMTMFSNGCGDADSNEQQAASHASLSLGSKGQIILRAANQTRELGSGFNDEQWHHIAMNVQRDSYVTVLVDTVDVSSEITLAGDDLGGFFNSQMVVGALRYVPDATAATPTVLKNFFKGQLDEIRIWKAYRTLSAVKHNAYNRLDGGEPGLLAYYPFEKSDVVANQLQTLSYLGDCVKNDNLSAVSTADAPIYYGAGGEMQEEAVKRNLIADNGPRLRASGTLTPIDINFTTNGKDKIVFTFPADLDKDRIEGCTVNFSVRGLKDLAGNRMKQSIDWCVYVNQNPLIWFANDNSLIQSIGSKISTKATIYNNSSTTQNWNIEGVPSWLEVSQSSGTVGPFSSTSVTLTTVEGTATGYYQSMLYLVGNDDIYAPMSINLSVTAANPGWKVTETDGTVWMNIFGRLKVNGNWADDENDIVGMFDDSGRCLALASPTYDKDMDSYFLYLNVKGNKDDANKLLKFRVWEAKTGIIYEGADVEYWKGSVQYSGSNQKFVNSSVIGDFSKPYIINAGKYIRQNLDLHAGWNWISLWVEPKAGATADKVFAPIADKISEIKSRMGGTLPSDFSQLQLYPANSYRLYMNEPATISIEGEMQNPDNVQITFRHPTAVDGVNWHWIGFPLWKMMTLSEAFADFQPVLNDVIKSEDAYAMYNGKIWVGNLKYLSPGTGYVYGYHFNNAADANWHYPNKAPRLAETRGFELGVDPLDYEDYTFVNVSIVDGSGSPISGFDYQLAAFTDEDGVCHGVSDGKSGETCPISIFGDDQDVYSFKLYNKENGQTFDLIGTKEYDNLTSPQTLRLVLTATGISNVNADTEDGNWYNLGGAKVDHIFQRGVYVKQNEKKIRK